MQRVQLIPIFFLLISAPGISTAKSCKAYRSCAEVIADYPDGKFGRKDGDQDGIPCENVCRSKKQVRELLKKVSGQFSK